MKNKFIIDDEEESEEDYWNLPSDYELDQEFMYTNRKC